MYKIDDITKLDLSDKKQYAIAKETLDRYELTQSEKKGLLEGIKNRGGGGDEPLKFLALVDEKYPEILYENIEKLYKKYGTEPFNEEYHYIMEGNGIARILYKIYEFRDDDDEPYYVVGFLYKGKDEGFPYAIRKNMYAIIA